MICKQFISFFFAIEKNGKQPVTTAVLNYFKKLIKTEGTEKWKKKNKKMRKYKYFFVNGILALAKENVKFFI